MHSKHLKKKAFPLSLTILADILLTIIILAVFFASVFLSAPGPVKGSKAEEPQEPQPQVTSVPTATPEITAQPVYLSPWQEKFADNFSEEVELTETSYKSPEVSIEINTVSTGEGSEAICYHVADIYVAFPENFSCYTAHNKMEYFDTQDAVEMFNESGAVLAISGDFMAYQKQGFLIRNGEIYSDTYSGCDICVLYRDGSMGAYIPRQYENADIMAKDPVQVWNFGPSLLDENGKALSNFKVSRTVAFTNPRSAVGYYEPGHYCFVVVDGRQEGYSAGMTLPELAKVFEELGCKMAYNLDGGGSAVMLFNGEKYSRQSNGSDRELGDLLIISERKDK